MPPKKIKKEKQVFNSHHLTADYWAFATILALPITMFFVNGLGANYVVSFFAGIAGSLGVIILNAFLEKRLWFFAPEWKKRLEAPDFSFRLAVASGVLFLMLETLLLFMFFTSPSLDRSLMQLIFARQCQDPQGDFVLMCDLLGASFPPEVTIAE